MDEIRIPPEDCVIILDSVAKVEQSMINPPDWTIFFLRVFKMVGNWWSNHIREALDEALLASDMIQGLLFMDSCNEIFYILILSIFLNEFGFYEKANLVYKVFLSISRVSVYDMLAQQYPPPKPVAVAPELTMLSFNQNFIPSGSEIQPR